MGEAPPPPRRSAPAPVPAGIAALVRRVDRLVRKLVELAEQALGRPPLPFAWLVFGSAGRRERVFRTDQDNGVVYADPPDPAAASAARAYFARLGAFVNDALVRCGFPPCPHGHMASNREWCRPLAAWKELFSGWVGAPTEEAVRRAAIFFDLRPVAGDEELGEQLRTHALRLGPRPRRCGCRGPHEATALCSAHGLFCHDRRHDDC